MYSPMMVMAPPTGYSMRSPYMTTAAVTAAKIYAQNQANKDFSQLTVPQPPTSIERGECERPVYTKYFVKFMKYICCMIHIPHIHPPYPYSIIQSLGTVTRRVHTLTLSYKINVDFNWINKRQSNVTLAVAIFKFMVSALSWMEPVNHCFSDVVIRTMSSIIDLDMERKLLRQE